MTTDLNLLFAQHSDKIVPDALSDMPTYRVPVDQIVAVIRSLKTAGYAFLTDLCGLDPGDNTHLGVVYHLHDMPNRARLRLKVFVVRANPQVPTVSEIFACANWMERETYDFYGIDFVGHPNLIRILNVDDMTYFPMRKEFTLEDPTRTDKNDAYFGR